MTGFTSEIFKGWINKDKETINFYEMDKFIKGVKEGENWDGETGHSIYNFLINQYEESLKTINSLKSDIKTLITEKDTEQENLNKEINLMMLKNYNLTNNNKDLKIKNINKEQKIKILSEENEKIKTELSKSEEEKQKIYTELEGLKSNTSFIKSSNSEYIDLMEKIETSEKIAIKEKVITGGDNNNLIKLNNDDIGLFMNNLKRGNSKILKKEQDFFKEEMEKNNKKEENKDQEIFIKTKKISYTTDYMPYLLKNSDKLGRIYTTENNKNIIPEYNTNLEIIEECDEEIKDTKQIKQNNQLLGGYIPNTTNKPKNQIYEINGTKKMFIGNEFTTLTDQGEKDAKQRHLDYKRKNNRYKKKN